MINNFDEDEDDEEEDFSSTKKKKDNKKKNVKDNKKGKNIDSIHNQKEIKDTKTTSIN